MTQQIPVNPNILKWAREMAGLSPQDVAKKLRRKSITVDTVMAWEKGEDSPTYPQLETLAYTIYKRPLALFFFPEPPQEETPRQSFRTLPEQEIHRMSSRLRYLRRQAQAMQLNLEELYDGINPWERQIVRDVKFDTKSSLSRMVTSVRNYLNIDLNTQFQWRNTDEAFKEWRYALEECGVFVFKEAFKDDVFSGFCLYDVRFPVIHINNRKSITHQIFTLFHELAHLLFRTGGVDTPIEDYIEFLQGDNKRIEISCNRFAGAFLVPNNDFNQRIHDISINDETIRTLANLYCVSREVILRKFYDRNLVTNIFYQQKIQQWKKETKEKSGSGGDYYLTKRVYLGERYLERVFSRYYQRQISLEQLADYMEVKVKSVPGMETLLFDKGVSA